MELIIFFLFIFINMKNNNQFFFSYHGNKRNEVDEIIKNIDFTDKDKIIETFCGTSAISFHIWLKYGDKFQYYLNDNSKSLISIYELFKNEDLDKIKDEINNISAQIKNKDDWNNHFKTAEQTPYKELYYLKFSTFGRKGFYPLNRSKKREIKLTKIQELFLKFIKEPYVFISCSDWFNIFDKFKDDKKAILIFDPPYINTHNDFYLEKSLNIYQYFYDNKIETFKSNIYLILEDIWIIRLLFNNNKVLSVYNKEYGLSRKKTNHIIISN